MSSKKLPTTQAQARRHLLLGLAHKGAVQLGLDFEARRAAQVLFAGHESLRDFSDQQLAAWCWELKHRGADIWVPAPPARGGSGWDRPTVAQWARIEQLGAALTLDASALRAFVLRTARVEDARFMTRTQASNVITGLEKWTRGRGVLPRSKTRAAIDSLLEDDHDDCEQ